MDPTFRVRFRKGEGVTKKGPLVVKHPPNHSANSANTNAVQSKEIRSPIGASPPLLGRRRPLSPDPRNSIRRGSIPTKDTEPQKSLKLRHHRERSNSPNSRRHAILRGTLSGPIARQTRTPASPPTKRYTPPSSPRIRRPISPRNFATPTESKSRVGPMKCFPVLPSMPQLPTPAEEKQHLPSPVSSRPSSPGSRRPASPRGTSPRGRGASPGSKPPPISEEELKLRVEKAQKARLYLLHQPGPNSFSVGSDSPSQKYKVIIGPQTCSCGHGPYCVHVLFVMIRVLKLSESDHLLMAGNLKDYEVEQLLRNWEERRKKAVQARERRTLYVSGRDRIPGKGFKRSPPSSPTSTLSASSDSCSDESQCPICLMNMVNGERLVVCESGCRNLFHHHCMSIWAADRHEQSQPLLCPLCRGPWSSRIYPRSKTNRESFKASRPGTEKDKLHSLMSSSFSAADGKLNSAASSPSMTRSMSAACHDSAYSSPCFGDMISKQFLGSTPLYGYPPTVRGEISAPLIHATSDELVPLPYTDPIPLEHESVASSWVAVFGADLVACLFSRDWAVRETGLRRLAHEVTKSLRWDYLVTTEKVRRNVISCSANILAQVANDPVYKVYIACLRCVKVLFSHLCPLEEPESSDLQSHFRPLLHTILLKCADGNRRTSQISLDFLIELSRGQRGELALSSSARGLGGISYVLSCILEGVVPSEAPWQWLLGRLCVLDRLLDEFPSEFQLQMVKLSPSECGYKLQHYDRLMTVVEFAFRALGSRHTTVSKLARRIYICGARMAAVEPAVFNQVCDMLAKLDVSLQARLKQRLRSMQTSGERRGSFSRFGHRLGAAANSRENNLSGSRLVRSVSHSPSRMLSALRSASPSGHQGKENADKADQQKPFIMRPNHLPLNSIYPLFKEKQNKLRLYQKQRAKNELPLIVQQALLSPNHKNKAVSMQKVNSFVKASLSQNQDSFNCNPPSPSSRSGRLNCLLGDEIGTPDTPSAPYSTPDWKSGLSEMANLVAKFEPPLPHIPFLNPVPKYLDFEGDPYHMSVEDTDYEEGKDWIKGPLIGTGAFSSCFQARDAQTGTLMAVKQVSICRNGEEEQERVEAAIEDEIIMMSRLRHPNVVRLFGATRLQTSFSVFSEWMAGGSVAAMLDKFGPFSEQVIVKYTNQILLGLSYLHDNMILHRDLKGANLLVDSTGQWLRIGDFGTAARLANKATITGEFQGQLLGTIAFMAPEVLRGDDYGRACDIWSIGCCIIEMATTKPPWGADHVSNQYKLMFRIATSTSPPLVPKMLSAPIKDMTLQCLQINSEKRPSTKALLKHHIFHNLPP